MIAGPRTPVWSALETLAERGQHLNIPALLAQDLKRREKYSRSAAGIEFDFSRQCIDDTILETLLQLPDIVDMSAAIKEMWRGDKINVGEDRAALHVALRQPENLLDELKIGGTKIAAEVLSERKRMLAYAEQVRHERNFDTVINIGIGGSDLGPAMAVRALKEFCGGGPKVLFISNVDGCALADALEMSKPARTLFIICSKSFTTQETLINAYVAREWIAAALGSDAVPNHFAAVSVNVPAMDAFGIHSLARFTLWDWVGGRYSLCSSIGLSVAISIGAQNFEQLLAGAYSMDQHFRQAPWAENLPVLMALVGIWNINFLHLPALAILPYADRLSRWPAYLQQLEMESNGKSVTKDNEAVTWSTAPIIWGEPGNNAQHSFFQMLHQGTLRSALDMILVEEAVGPAIQHQWSMANARAQIDAFTFGTQDNTEQALAQTHLGSRPLSVLTLEALTPPKLGALISLYEHKVYVQSILWGINAFDQFGVELGKRLCPTQLSHPPAQSL